MYVTRYYLRATLLGLAGILMLGCDGSAITDAATGAIQVTAITTGADVDVDGYGLSINGGSSREAARNTAAPWRIGINGMVTIGPLTKGSYTLALHGVAPNCTVNGLNPRSIRLDNPTSASPVAVSFHISCVETDDDGSNPWNY